MYANVNAKRIEMSQNEAKAAGKIGTPEFEELQLLRAAFPDYRIEVKASKKAKNQLKIDYKFMEEYIQKHDDENGTIMEELNFLRGKKAKEGEYVETVNFMDIKNWFLKKFPAIKDAQKEYRKKIDKILNAA